jgi:8-oxo-dGTP pyrophosphatase MutT (NUDIX family)
MDENTFYRVSAKALILDETGKKFAIILEDNGLWEIPGGGIDWGESPAETLKREIMEEMGLEVTSVNESPSYYLIGKNMSDQHSLNLVFETKVKNLNFTPSKEAMEMKFVDKEDIKSLNAFRTVKELAEQFNKNNN